MCSSNSLPMRYTQTGNTVYHNVPNDDLSLATILLALSLSEC